MGLCSCLASCLAWGVQHWSLLVVEWSWVLALKRRSLGELSPTDITWGCNSLVVQCLELGSPTSEAQAWHPAGAPRPCQPHSSFAIQPSLFSGSDSFPGSSWAAKRQGDLRTCYQIRLPLPDIPQAKTLRCRGLQQREGLFTRQAGDEMGEQISNPPPWSQGICGIKNKEAVWCEDLRKCDWRKVYAFFIFVFSWSW